MTNTRLCNLISGFDEPFRSYQVGVEQELHHVDVASHRSFVQRGAACGVSGDHQLPVGIDVAVDGVQIAVGSASVERLYAGLRAEGILLMDTKQSHDYFL